MEENEKQNIPKDGPGEVKKEAEPLPFCTLAASAEHARAPAEDEPCDDARTGDYERK
ncbi:MAG: hypothetical protein AB1512_04305 [Thermodesulfobacteriota bacterium]